MLKFDKLHDSVCEDNSWQIQAKFLSHVHKRFLNFFPTVFNVFNFYLNDYYIYAIGRVTRLARGR